MGVTDTSRHHNFFILTHTFFNSDIPCLAQCSVISKASGTEMISQPHVITLTILSGSALRYEVKCWGTGCVLYKVTIKLLNHYYFLHKIVLKRVPLKPTTSILLYCKAFCIRNTKPAFFVSLTARNMQLFCQ